MILRQNCIIGKSILIVYLTEIFYIENILVVFLIKMIILPFHKTINWFWKEFLQISNCIPQTHETNDYSC